MGRLSLKVVTEWTLEGMTNVLLLMLNRKLGTIPQEAVDYISWMSEGSLNKLATALLDFNTMDDLQAWLDQNPPVPDDQHR